MSKKFTFEELKQLSGKDDLHLLVGGKGELLPTATAAAYLAYTASSCPVYAVAPFVDEVRIHTYLFPWEEGYPGFWISPSGAASGLPSSAVTTLY